MIARYNTISFLFGAPGLALQLGGGVAVRALVDNPETARMLSTAAVAIGTTLVLIGLAFYAKAKGRHPGWCLMAFLSVFGYIVLALLADKAPAGKPVSA